MAVEFVVLGIGVRILVVGIGSFVRVRAYVYFEVVEGVEGFGVYGVGGVSSVEVVYSWVFGFGFRFCYCRYGRGYFG